MRQHSSRLRGIVFLGIISTISFSLFAQQIVATDNAVASPVGGWHPSYEMKRDPENARNAIICGARSMAKDNAFYGFVYASSDGGRTWREALEDRHSTFESEHSCAFGVHGIAYYVASASKVVDGEPHHDLGVTRIYVSLDAGKTWKLAIETGWTDYSTAVVETNPGPDQNRLYIFFNNLQTFYSSIGDGKAMNAEAKGSDGTRVGMISYKDGDTAIAGPFSSDQMAKEGYRGSYPAPAVLLKDGSVLTFFSTKRRTVKDEREFMVAAARTDSSRTSLQAPVKIVDSLNHSEPSPTDVECGSYYLSPAGAYDERRDKVYFTYSDVRDGACRLFLTMSGDKGSTWSNPEQVRTPKEDEKNIYANLAIAVNRDGTLGFLWRNSYRSGCWQFAASTDDGRSISRAQQLGTCRESAVKPSALTSAYLWTSIFQSDSKSPQSTPRINLRNTRNNVWRNQDAITTTSDGKFHIVWADEGDGDGELRTESMTVTPAKEAIANSTLGLTDATSRVSLLYGDNQFYDENGEVITLDVAVRNDSENPLRTPIKLAVPLTNDLGFVDIANADNGVRGAGAVWDISFAIPGGILAPGATTKPFALKFHYRASPDAPRKFDDIFGLNVRVYAKP